MARHCSYTTSKVEEWRSIDLADLRRWRMLDPARIWKSAQGVDQMGVIVVR
jgi:hypothetical protein